MLGHAFYLHVCAGRHLEALNIGWSDMIPLECCR